MSDPDVKPPARPSGSPRKEELLWRSLEYAAQHGISDLSLRPLAKAIGSSPRVLLYLFGSKDELIRDVLALNRAEQLTVLDQALAGSHDAGAALQTLWEWIIDPARDSLRRLFFEAYIRSLDAEGAWQDFAARSVDDWLASFRDVIVRAADGRRDGETDGHAEGRTDRDAHGRTDRDADGRTDAALEATLVLAVMRGLLLDLLASGDRERVDQAWRSFMADRC